MQGVDVLFDLTLQRNMLGLGHFNARTRLLEIQFGRNPAIKQALHQLPGLFAARQGVCTELQQRQIATPGQPGMRHARDDAELRRALPLFAGQIILQRLSFQTAYPPEKVQLKGRDAQIDAVLAHRGFLAHRPQIGRQTLAGGAGACINGRETLGTLNAVQRPRRLHVQGCDFQVAVVFQCLCNQLLQAGIAEKLLPGGRGTRLVPGAGERIVCGNRRCGTFVIRHQRAGTEQRTQHRGKHQGAVCHAHNLSVTTRLR